MRHHICEYKKTKGCRCPQFWHVRLHEQLVSVCHKLLRAGAHEFRVVHRHNVLVPVLSNRCERMIAIFEIGGQNDGMLRTAVGA